jgi:hypothetical protein
MVKLLEKPRSLGDGDSGRGGDDELDIKFPEVPPFPLLGKEGRWTVSPVRLRAHSPFSHNSRWSLLLCIDLKRIAVGSAVVVPLLGLRLPIGLADGDL